MINYDRKTSYDLGIHTAKKSVGMNKDMTINWASKASQIYELVQAMLDLTCYATGINHTRTYSFYNITEIHLV